MFNKQEIERFKSLKTPFYYYDIDSLKNTLNNIKSASSKYGYHVHYALKANCNVEILKEIQKEDFGADCVSGNEILKAIEIGFPTSHIAFAGVGKSDEEILIGLENDIFSFNCESLEEMEVINELASKQNKVANISLRINPNVNAKTHHYITTGLEENKFGMNMWQMDEILEFLATTKNLKLIGLHFHIGSQITDLNVFKGLCLRVNEIQEWFISRQIIVEHINVGGGLGVDYENPDSDVFPDFNKFFDLFNDFLELRPSQKLHFELGRSVVANCGSLVSKVLYVKKSDNTNFAIVDAGMTELLRPALYNAYHKIESVNNTNEETRYDVVGPICESSDSFAKAIMLPELKRGDLIVIRTTGAYGEEMSLNYNLREKALAYYKE